MLEVFTHKKKHKLGFHRDEFSFMIAYGCSSLCLLCHVLVVAFEKLDIIFLWILKNISKKLEQLSVPMLDQP